MRQSYQTTVAILLASGILVHNVSAFMDSLLCPAEVCVCDRYEIKCKCDKRQNVALTSLFNFDIHTIVIQECGVVRIPLTSMLNLQLHKVEMNDLLELHVSSYAFAGVIGIDQLKLTNIERLEIKPHGFSGLSNVTHIQLSNVNIETIPVWAFGGLTDIGLFEISNSVIGTVETLAFILSNVTTLHVSNTAIDTLGNTSMIVHNSDKIEFINCSIGDTENSSFSLASINNLEFTNCSFQNASEDMILAKEVSTFVFHKCFVETLRHKALWSIEVTDHVEFTENRFQTAESGSIFPITGPFGAIHGKTSVQASNNSFFCNCQIAWMLLDKHFEAYSNIIHTGFCHGPPEIADMLLVNLHPKLSATGECEEISIKPRKGTTTKEETRQHDTKEETHQHDTKEVATQKLLIEADVGYRSSISSSPSACHLEIIKLVFICVQFLIYHCLPEHL